MSGFLAGAERLELSRTVLETAMLPLHHAPSKQRWYYNTEETILSMHFFIKYVKVFRSTTG